MGGSVEAGQKGRSVEADQEGGEVDAYVAGLSEAERRALERLRQTITRLVPSVDEVIRVGVPQFRYRGRPLVSIGAAKRHLSLYVMYSKVLPQLADELDGLDWTPTVVRFTTDDPLPEDLVATIVHERIAELER